MEQKRIVQNAMRKNKMKSTANDVTECVEAEGNLQDVIELLANTGLCIRDTSTANSIRVF